jgi:tRNA A-37 threonylcarbamoyl transferase component Bud32/tetratricopeptide (TPR) repeat protein
MGEVYAAYDPSLDRRVALKMVHRLAVAPDAHVHARMLREAQAIAKLSHPNVVVVYEVGTFDEKVFIAMEFVEGRTLAEWLADGGHSWREIVGVFLQAAQGLSAAHRAGFVHRDFKPQNVMVTSEGHVRVMDFGLARRIDSDAANEVSDSPVASPLDVAQSTLTRTGEQLGTPLYMAPEQFASGRVDARTDQFSFCVALFWALYGVHPFGAGQTSAANPPKTTNPPAWLRAAVRRGLRAAPEDRWPSMDALSAALAPDASRRSKRLVRVAVAATLVAAIGLTGAFMATRHRAICQSGVTRMAGVWELAGNAATAASRRQRVRTAILRSGVSGAERIWDRVSTLLDRHATKWLATYRDACEATHVRGEQSEEAFDLRMQCMTENLDSTRALADLLAEGESSVIANAVQMVNSLDDYQRCSNVPQLRLGVPLPKDPRIRSEVAELRRRLAVVAALIESGRCQEGAATAKELVKRAEAVGYCPLLAEALVINAEGNVYHARSTALALFDRAIFTAESCGADRILAHAATESVFVHGVLDPMMAERMASLAKAALERIGGDPRLESWLANNVAAALYRQNRLSEALAELERSVRIKSAFQGPDSVDVARSETNLALALAKLGRSAEALPTIERAIHITEKWLPEDSYWIENAYENYSFVLLRLGRLNDAEAAARRVLRNGAGAVNTNLGTVGNANRTLGLIALERAQFRTAVQLFERALDLQQSAQESRFEIAETKFGLARALAQTSQRHRAACLAKEALTTFAASSFGEQKMEIVRWLEGNSLDSSQRCYD